jgi:hypothetical protein
MATAEDQLPTQSPYMTPQQIESMRQMAAALMKPSSQQQPMYSPWQAAGQLANTALGAYSMNRANDAQQQYNNTAAQLRAGMFSPYLGVPGGAPSQIPAAASAAPATPATTAPATATPTPAADTSGQQQTPAAQQQRSQLSSLLNPLGLPDPLGLTTNPPDPLGLFSPKQSAAGQQTQAPSAQNTASTPVQTSGASSGTAFPYLPSSLFPSLPPELMNMPGFGQQQQMYGQNAAVAPQASGGWDWSTLMSPTMGGLI